MATIVEREELRGEELFIFRRPTSPNWQCRVKFSGLAAFDRSLGTPSKPEAITCAHSLYGELQYRQRQGLAIKSWPFAVVAGKLLADMDSGHRFGSDPSHQIWIWIRLALLELLMPKRVAALRTVVVWYTAPCHW